MLSIRWVEVKSSDGLYCDLCMQSSSLLVSGWYPVIEGIDIAISKTLSGHIPVADSPFVACVKCQQQYGIKLRDIEISADRFIQEWTNEFGKEMGVVPIVKWGLV